MVYNPFSLNRKHILITGASSGIGRATALVCAKMGAKVILTARNEERLSKVIEEMEGDGHQYIVADLTQQEHIEHLVSELPTIDGCVHCAGYNSLQLIPFIKHGEVEEMFRTNVEAAIMLTHLLVKRKRLNKPSSLVFVASIAGYKVCSPGNSIYSATKGALCSFMREAALELSSKKIRCNAILPGMVETPLKQNKSAITTEQWEKNLELYPLKRFGRPEDVAHAAVYLLSDASEWVTGTELIIDGGRTLN
ncbi:MAG: SDR family oxidoreductase [Alistipes sp.]|nr:SDR family oxidoreductase [Alistipes sp.]